MKYGSIWRRLVRGTRWTWISDRHRGNLPGDLDATVMSLESSDRMHAKQGRTTARFVFHSAEGALSVYLKRHYHLPWTARLGALVNPAGRHTPASAEWAHLNRVSELGIAVPEVVAAGERIGPWGALQSFLMVAELTGCLPLHEAVPALAERLDPQAFTERKRALIAEMVEIVTTLHGASAFHKDLYLCHFYLDLEQVDRADAKLTLIDLHRMAEHRRWPDRWRWKDLGQLLFSTYGVTGLDDRDRLRFWRLYRRRLGLRRPRMHARVIRLKAERYLAHNR